MHLKNTKAKVFISCGRLFVVVTAMFMVLGCNNDVTRKDNKENQSVPLSVIFETDMGNDIDDALALDMLYKYADQQRIKILAIMSNKNSDYSVRYIDILNTWFGYPDIPIGKVVNGADSENGLQNYAKSTWDYEKNGNPVFRGVVKDYSKLPDAVMLYRKILAQQPDTSVTIISVGFSTNLARLLHTQADEYSPLSGKELIAKKVKLLSVMAGEFQENRTLENNYNTVKDIKSAQIVFEEWPTEIVASPCELALNITYPAKSIQNDFDWAADHPVVVAYEKFLTMPYDRPTWDLTSVLYAVEGDERYFTLSDSGKIAVDDKGYTDFSKDDKGLHRYLKATPEQAAAMRARLIEVVTTKPKNRE